MAGALTNCFRRFDRRVGGVTKSPNRIVIAPVLGVSRAQEQTLRRRGFCSMGREAHNSRELLNHNPVNISRRPPLSNRFRGWYGVTKGPTQWPVTTKARRLERSRLLLPVRSAPIPPYRPRSGLQFHGLETQGGACHRPDSAALTVATRAITIQPIGAGRGLE